MMLKGNKFFGLPSKRDIQTQFYAEQKQKKANQLALPAPHPHTHGRALDLPAANRQPNLPDDDVDAQFTYDKALWGAQTHTRTRDSLRYL